MISASEMRTTTPSGNIFLDTLTFSQAYAPGIQITYVLQGKPGEGPNGGATWTANGARTAFQQALASWSAVANVSFVEAAGPYNGLGGTAGYDWIETFEDLPEDIAGQHDLPFAGTLVGSYNSVDDYFARGPLVAGSIAYSTFVHEIGHGLGLLHSHNDGDEEPGDPTFPGVDEFYDEGSYALNQGVFTSMSYNSGYSGVGFSLFEEYGWETGPMAFDIAAVQRLYGANMATNSGVSTYVLPQSNQIGTYWLCIWDAGGADNISAGTTGQSAIIDLRAATLLQETGGGGFVSRIAGVIGGFTIANGVVIENATGGAGDDRIHGNAAANRLDGGAGYDITDYSGTSADLVIDLAAGSATGDGADTLVAIEAAIGGSGDDRLVAFDGTPAGSGMDVFKQPLQNLGARSLALDLDFRFANRAGDPAVAATAGMSTVQVHAENGNGSDYYSFFVASAGPVIIDIDNSFALDTLINVYDEAGTLLDSNDDGDSIDPGSGNEFDSYLVLENAPAGKRLFVEITNYEETGLGFGTSYDMNISLVTSRVADGTRRLGSLLDGGGGDDVLVSGRGDDLIHGGSGTDIAAYAGPSSAYTVTGTASDKLVVESQSDGRDQVFDVEGFRFADGRFVWSPVSGLIRENVWPVLQPIGPLVTAEDTPLHFTPVASDEDGDELHFILGPVPNGTLTATNPSALVFTPSPDFSGQTTITVYVSDGNGGGANTAIDITVTPVNDAPLFASSALAIEAAPGAAVAIAAGVNDPDGDAIVFSASDPAHGTVVSGTGGSFVYTPQPGYLGPDSFTLTATDPAGSAAQQVVTVDITPFAEVDWRLYALDGFAGEFGGSGLIFGTNGFQDIAVLDRPGAIVFDGSFNRGDDLVRLDGSADTWKVSLSGSSAVFSDGDTYVRIPVGMVGMAVGFDDGARSLRFDQTAAQVKLGSQIVGASQTTISAAPDSTVLPAGAITGAKAIAYLASGGEITAGGRLDVFGTIDSEQVELTRGNALLDASFNRGGDLLSLGLPASAFTARLSGSMLVLGSAALDVQVPVGNVGMPIDFGGASYQLRYDAAADSVLLGTQAIGDATAALTLG